MFIMLLMVVHFGLCISEVQVPYQPADIELNRGGEDATHIWHK